ncbi:uncharacterized protein C8R40DRAFT_1162343 [Lentinula edodes]|uniref:uncharacterized protein n=1 Tax=Lentinula edodes TaxID=5353 RepID=UPI001E8EDCB1|nr:uncharacterized protein C8R40DRAFT_1162343 [Lentinula edodes]KAH7871985.1 hypothetical protein C8R40DRAFT_1162343 [Lentinula edodes]
MISRCRAKSWIIQLKEDNGLISPTNQRGLKGNIIIFPQKISAMTKILPPSIEDLSQPICVIFVGSSRPSDDWLRTQAKPLTVRPARVREALVWLKAHNRWYKDVIINEEVLGALPDESSLPVHIEHVVPEEINESLTNGYDQNEKSQSDLHESCLTFESVVVADVDGNATVNELRAAAMRHIKKGGSYVEISHESNPVNEFFNPSMFPMIYPTLFPYGIGGFEDYRRSCPVSMKRHVKQLFAGKCYCPLH